MKTLNLVYPEKSDIKYKISKFPDGQQNIVIEPFPLYHESVIGHSYKDGVGIRGEAKSIIQIKSRLNNWLDLELITCTVASLRELGIDEIHLYVPYVVGARSDRKFEEGGNNYLKDVITPVINSLEFSSVTVLDPHSDCLEMGIKGFRKDTIGQFGLFKWSVGKIYDSTLPKIGGELKDIEGKYVLVSPDAGASKKIYKLAEQIGYKGDIITCSKDRDKDGKLTKVNVPINIGHTLKDIIIIDDICDGGATFINIAKEIKDTQKLSGITNPNKIYLIVTHGIFSKGFEELEKYFDGIYCTNSYKQHTPEKEHKYIVKQLNVF